MVGMLLQVLLCVCVIVLTPANAAGTLVVSNTIGSNMVLQRAPYSSSIFGWATAGDKITVAFNQKNYETIASADGGWKVKLDPTPAGGPYDIAVTSATGEKVAFTNVLFGDVWLCGGQSNMQFTVASAYNSTEELRAADNYPNIRVFTVGELNYSSTPLKQLAKLAQPWSVASARTIGVGNWSEFSAVCWFTGRDLYNKYKVPIGLISSNWGGTVVQAWSSPEALKSCNVTASGTGNEANSVLYNSMIVPFLNQTILGALWYQGESNVGETSLYACLFPAMIKDWRSRFPYSFTFLFVELAPWVTGADVQDLRQAQLAALQLPSVGYASAIDLGDVDSPFGNIHPRSKQPVGARLALAAEALAYNESKTVVWRGPELKSATLLDATATITFDLFGSKSLVSVNATCPKGVTPTICLNWEVTLKNGTLAKATEVSVSLDTVKIQVPGTGLSASIVEIRYAYSPWPVATIYNAEGIPALPFEYLAH